MNRIDPKTYAILGFTALWTVALIWLFAFPPLGIALAALLIWRMSGLRRSRDYKRRQAEDELLRFHLQGSVRGPHMLPRPPKRERLY